MPATADAASGTKLMRPGPYSWLLSRCHEESGRIFAGVSHHLSRARNHGPARALARMRTKQAATSLFCQPRQPRRLRARSGRLLPPALRASTRPVAGSDYWGRGSLRRFVGLEVFNAVLIDRTTVSRTENPLDPVLSALASGYSLIFFPEGTRNTSSQALLPFKSGLFRLAQAFPNVQLIPVWVDNIGRVLPKGEVFPVPLLCSVTFGVPVNFEPSEVPRPSFWHELGPHC